MHYSELKSFLENPQESENYHSTKAADNLKNMLQTSIVIFITAETACILTAETVDLLLYKLFIR